MAIFNPHGLLPIPVRKESKVSTPLARLTHSPCTDAFAPGKPHLQLPRLAGPAATNLLIQETKEEHGRTPNSKLQCVLAPVRLEEHGQLSGGETSAMSRKKGRQSIFRSLLQAQLLCTRRAAQGSREPMLKSIESALLERTNLDETIRLRLKIQA